MGVQENVLFPFLPLASFVASVAGPHPWLGAPRLEDLCACGCRPPLGRDCGRARPGAHPGGDTQGLGPGAAPPCGGRGLRGHSAGTGISTTAVSCCKTAGLILTEAPF